MFAIRSGEEVMRLVSYQHPGLDSAQDPHGDCLERNKALRGGEGRVKGFGLVITGPESHRFPR